MAACNMMEVQLKLIKDLGHKEQAVDLLSLDKFDGDFVVYDPNIHLRVFGFSLEPGAPEGFIVGLVRLWLNAAAALYIACGLILCLVPLTPLSPTSLFLHQQLQLIHCSQKLSDVLNRISHHRCSITLKEKKITCIYIYIYTYIENQQQN